MAVDDRAPPGFAGLVIGLTVGGIITTIGNIAESSLKPRPKLRAVPGRPASGRANLWGFFPIYVIGPIAGAVVAAFLYDYLSS